MNKKLIMNIAFIAILLLSSPAFAADPAPQCVEEKIAIQKLTQQLMQMQYRLAPLDFEAAQKEQTRLESLLPKKNENPKKASATEKK